jgi:hypothetical protein
MIQVPEKLQSKVAVIVVVPQFKSCGEYETVKAEIEEQDKNAMKNKQNLIPKNNLS